MISLKKILSKRFIIKSTWLNIIDHLYSVKYFAHLSQGVSPVIQLELL